jgi:acyl-homoserine lactone acylase PvdQ
MQDFPSYMVEDKHDDKRRAKRSREILGQLKNVTFDELQALAFDTKVYWAETELPVYAREFAGLKKSDPELARQVAPYIEHLLAWDYRSTLESTAATLCVVWYEELYGSDYPGEELRPQYVNDMPRRFRALVRAASKLQSLYGSWRVPYGQTHRIQRHADVADLLQVPFQDDQPSLPCAGLHGPMGVIFTQYYMPTINIPLFRTLNKHYGVIGATYMAVYEFGERVRGASVLQFGTSGDPHSPHYFDQAKLLSRRCRGRRAAGLSPRRQVGPTELSEPSSRDVSWRKTSILVKVKSTSPTSCAMRRRHDCTKKQSSTTVA